MRLTGTIPLLAALSLPVAARGAEVRSVIVGRAFFVGGTDDGLVVGREVEVRRRGRVVAACTIDRASRSSSSCSVSGVERGDDARPLGPAPEPRPERAPSDIAGPGRTRSAAPAEVARVRAADLPLVEHVATAVPGRRLRAEASIGNASFVRAEGDGFHRQRVDATARDLSLGFLNARAHVDLTVLTYASRPDAARFRDPATAQLYVHETSIESRVAGQDWTAAIGRIRPWYAPGVPYLDGAQLGVRLWGRRLEVGILAGGLPDPIRLEPSPERWLAGVYAAADLRNDEVWSRTQLRAGVASAPGPGARGELEGGLRVAWRSWLSAAVEARASFDDRGPSLASARGSIGGRPVEWFRFDLDGRIRNPQLDLAGPSALVGAEHAYAATRFLLGPSFEISAVGGFGRMSEERFGRAWIGPELAWPRLFGVNGGMSTGYQETVGDLPGRSVFVQLHLHPSGGLDLLSRLTGTMDETDGPPLVDLGLHTHADWRISSRFSLRGSVMARTPLLDVGDERLALGFVGRVSLVGRL